MNTNQHDAQPTLNIGLSCFDGTYISSYRPYDYLRGLNIEIAPIQVKQNKVERIAIYLLDRALTTAEANGLSDVCNRVTISQYDPLGTNSGAYGDMARKFDLQSFLFAD